MLSRRKLLGFAAAGVLANGSGGIATAHERLRGGLPDGMQISRSVTTHGFCGAIQDCLTLPVEYGIRFNVGPPPEPFLPSPPKVERAIAKFFAMSSVKLFVVTATSMAGDELEESTRMCQEAVNLDDAEAAAFHAYWIVHHAHRAVRFRDEREWILENWDCVEYSTHFAMSSVREAQSKEDRFVTDAGRSAARVVSILEKRFIEQGDEASEMLWLWDLALSTLAGALEIERSLTPAHEFAEQWV